MAGPEEYRIAAGLVRAGVAGPPNVGGGWPSSTAWVVAFGVMALLAGVAWLISDSSGRGRSAARDRQDRSAGIRRCRREGHLPDGGPAAGTAGNDP